MHSSDFYTDLPHETYERNGKPIQYPSIFYTDYRYFQLTALAPLKNVKRLLPSEKIFPYQPFPGLGVIAIAVYEYRQTDFGPYNEIGLGVPVSYGKSLPLFTGSLRKMPTQHYFYLHQLPLNSQYPCDLGVEMGGYPKYMADIEFTDETGWVTCTMHVDGQHAVTIKGRTDLPMKQMDREITHPLNFKDGRLLRSETILAPREMGFSMSQNDVELTYGDHELGQIIQELEIKRIFQYAYCPACCGNLTFVLESLPG